MGYKKHKFNIFPDMLENDYENLKQDIKVNGYDNSMPITLFQGDIIDGWHRYKACEELQIKPVFVDFKGSETEAIEFIMRTNKRRNLTSMQWACIAVEAEDIIKVIKAEAKARQIASLKQNKKDDTVGQQIAQRTNEVLADMFNTNKQYIKEATKLKAEEPEIYAEVQKGTKTITEAKKDIRSKTIAKEREEIKEKAKLVKIKSNLFVADIKTFNTDKQYDFIITDPPYPKEYLPLYETLAIRSKDWLKADGLLIVMCGQMYLNQIYEKMSKHLTYYWTGCYLTQGQPTPLRHRQVNTTWKPILIFIKNEKYKGKIFGDVFISDKNDKDFHKWGQSVSGMESIIKQVATKGQTILDPFLGAGTTGVAAIKQECLFDGFDIDKESVKIAKGRIYDQERELWC
jgi:DNA modification methylase